MNTKFLRFISIFEMIGGILGILLTGYLTFFSPNSIFNAEIPLGYRLITALIFLTIFALYSLSFMAGLHLWQKKESGIRLSIIIQLFQIPYIVVPGLVYSFISGLQLGAALTLSSSVVNLTALFYLTSTFSVYFGSSTDYIIIGVNIISIVMIAYLRKVKKMMGSSQESAEAKNELRGVTTMNKSIKLVLPNELENYRELIEKSVKPSVKITAKKDKPLIWESKFGGNPYLPIGYNYPVDSNGIAMRLLAQINFEEVPNMDAFPSKGILQFYISSKDDVYGINFDDQTAQENFKVSYIPEVIKDESQILTDFSFINESDEDYLPITHECALTFEVDYQPVSTGDYQFRKIIGEDSIEFVNNVFENEEDAEAFYNHFTFPGHRIGGYAYFTQSDPREGHYEDYEVLLLQIDTDDKNGIMWGDCGVANFFIRLTDLKKLDFSKVLYNWDCC